MHRHRLGLHNHLHRSDQRICGVQTRPLTVNVSGTQTYGGSPTFTYTTSPSGGTVSGLTCTTVGSSTPINSTLGTGNYTILGSSCSATANADYNYTFSGVTNGFVVSAAALTVNVSGTQTYGGSPTFTYTTSPSGVTVSSLTCTKVGSSTTISPTLAPYELHHPRIELHWHCVGVHNHLQRSHQRICG